VIGPARFLPADAVRDELAPALDAPALSGPMSLHQELVAEQVVKWAGSALAVTAPEAAHAARIAEEALAVVRFFIRRHIRVNVEIHKVGLVGDFLDAKRDYVVLWEDGQLIAGRGWKRIGGTVPFIFRDEVLDAWDADPKIGLIGEQLALQPDERSRSGRRALTALTMLDAGLRSLEPGLRILCATIAVEALFSGDEKRSKNTDIARRIAYLTCGARCGREFPLCAYTDRPKDLKQLFTELDVIAHDPQREWRCSAYLDVVAPDAVFRHLPLPSLFNVRNEIAHEGGVTLTERELLHLIRVADEAVMAALDWYAANPDGDMATLDDRIAASSTSGP
jgi:hypothetical protein